MEESIADDERAEEEAKIEQNLSEFLFPGVKIEETEEIGSK